MRLAIHLRKGGILWHTEDSGKLLTMVWLERWIREHAPGVGARSVLRLLMLLYRFYALPRAQGTAKQLVAFLGLDPVPIAVARKILVGRGRSFAPVDLSRPLLNPFLESYSLDFHERISRSPEGL
nr:hypothetical protein [uncultured Caldilinea sp.]